MIRCSLVLRGGRHARLPAGILLLLLLAAPLPALSLAQAAQGRIDFDRDVRPILAENCLTCHGFDEGTRMAGLRLDTLQGAAATLPSGRQAVVAGNAAASELIKRVTAHGAAQMPPGGEEKRLSAQQVELLRSWIDSGARFEEHWAFKSPVRPPLPAVKQAGWVRNPIDRFILQGLEREGLRPSPEADRVTLIRRLSLDLTGLPPTPAEVNHFLSDLSGGAYERLVDRLLASPHYGERMAMDWLDLARYADTHGYHIDSHRDMWLWRDWVVGAFNRNLPYDQFVVEQLAGDLLPGATLDQKVATGFNRNHPINFEGGAIPEEYHAAYIFDRIDTTSTAFLGLTMRCAQCHDHKYDPLTQREFYQFYALFNNVPEEGLDGRTGNAKPFVPVPDAAQKKQLASIQARIESLEAGRKNFLAASTEAREAWQKEASVIHPPALDSSLAAHYSFEEDQGGLLYDGSGRQSAGEIEGTATLAEGRLGRALKLDGKSTVALGAEPALAHDRPFSFGAWIQPEGAGAMTVLSRLDEENKLRGWDLYLSGGKAFVHLIHEWEGSAIRVNTRKPLPAKGWVHLFATYDGSGRAGGLRIYVNGAPVDLDVTHDTLKGEIAAAVPARIGRRNSSAPYTGLLDDLRVYDRELSANEVSRLQRWPEVAGALAAGEKRSDDQKKLLAEFYVDHVNPEGARLSQELAAARRSRSTVEAAIPTTMVMEEMASPRPTHILLRGQYDAKGEAVKPGAPEALRASGVAPPADRLEFARWLVRPEHPLTSRVQVNRLWQMHFGTGLVATSENFGTQGDRPSHPELLDWLATEYVRLGWNTKALQRAIVTSAAYRQASAVTPEHLAADPTNRLLARMPRLRLSAEAVRDQALAASGLLVNRLGGPSVRPYQPAGLWEEIAFGGEFTAQKYVQDHGDALYRRSMYTFWKRTCPPPSLQTFDAPEREFCIVRRSATNTPLQSLVVMNDITFVEAARCLAERMMTDVSATPKDRIRYGVRLLLARQPSDEELRVLTDLWRNRLAAYRADPAAAAALLKVGESPRDETLDPASHAAYTSIASVLLNLDETITRN